MNYTDDFVLFQTQSEGGTVSVRIDYLDKNNLTDNTVLLFMSDNGGLAAHTRAGQLHVPELTRSTSRQKVTACEGGVART